HSRELPSFPTRRSSDLLPPRPIIGTRLSLQSPAKLAHQYKKDQESAHQAQSLTKLVLFLPACHRLFRFQESFNIILVDQRRPSVHECGNRSKAILGPVCIELGQLVMVEMVEHHHS